MWWCVLLFALAVGAVSLENNEDTLLVQTKSGPVRGLSTSSRAGRPVDVWFGIPYAAPPVGQLRFKAPEPVQPWEEERYATQMPNSCYQTIDTHFGDFTGATMWNVNTPLSEDCLYLNVVVPNPRPKNASVLVFVHGGGFHTGTSTLDVYDLRTLASEEDLIVVSMQYRVASLGFLYFNSSEVPGNMGLLDQALSLKWVHENIAAFGGNPDNVTLMGHSAGAASVSLHLLSNISRDYFNQVILLGGASTASWSSVTPEVSILRGLRLAAKVGCPHNPVDLQATIECLRNVDAKTLVYNEFDETDVAFDFGFVPVVDGATLSENPLKALKNGQFKNTSILLGSNSNEGNMFLVYYASDLFPLDSYVNVTRAEFLRTVTHLNPHSNKIALDAIAFEYTDWVYPNDPDRIRDALDKMPGDCHFTCPVNQIGEHYAELGNDVYLYQFQHRSSLTPWPTWTGVLHGYELGFILGDPLDNSKAYTASEVELSKKVMRYWANFVRTGNPNLNPDGTLTTAVWPAHQADNQVYLGLAADDIQTGLGLRARQCAFWTKYLPKLVEATRNAGASERSRSGAGAGKMCWSGAGVEQHPKLTCSEALYSTPMKCTLQGTEDLKLKDD